MLHTVCTKRDFVDLRQSKTAAKIWVRDMRKVVKEVVKSIVTAPGAILLRAWGGRREHIFVVVWHFEVYGEWISGAMISVIDDMGCSVWGYVGMSLAILISTSYLADSLEVRWMHKTWLSLGVSFCDRSNSSQILSNSSPTNSIGNPFLCVVVRWMLIWSTRTVDRWWNVQAGWLQYQ